MQLQELYKAFNEFNNFEAIDLKIQFALDCNKSIICTPKNH